MQMDKKWLEEEERQMVTTHTHTHNCYIAFHSFAKPNRKLSIFDLWPAPHRCNTGSHLNWFYVSMIWRFKGWLGLFSGQHTHTLKPASVFLQDPVMRLDSHVKVLFLCLRRLCGGLFHFLFVQNVNAVLLKINLWYADLTNPVQQDQHLHYLWATTLLVICWFLFSFFTKVIPLKILECARNINLFSRVPLYTYIYIPISHHGNWP